MKGLGVRPTVQGLYPDIPVSPELGFGSEPSEAIQDSTKGEMF